MATQDVAFYDNTVEDHKTSNLSIVSYKVFAADEDQQHNSLGEASEAQGLRAIQTDYESDLKYNSYPGNISISANHFNNQFSFPTLSNDFGKLWYFKNGARIPDIAYDGIFPEGVQLQDPSVKLCIDDNGAASFAFLDAANDFENFSNDLTPFNCLAD
jgi:hypothetical protein